MIRLTWRALQKTQIPGMDCLLCNESEFLRDEPGNLLFKFPDNSAVASLQAFSTDLNHTVGLRRTARLAPCDFCIETN